MEWNGMPTLCRPESCWCRMSASLLGNWRRQSRQASLCQSVSFSSRSTARSGSSSLSLSPLYAATSPRGGLCRRDPRVQKQAPFPRSPLPSQVTQMSRLPAPLLSPPSPHSPLREHRCLDSQHQGAWTTQSPHPPGIQELLPAGLQQTAWAGP